MGFIDVACRTRRMKGLKNQLLDLFIGYSKSEDFKIFWSCSRVMGRWSMRCSVSNDVGTVVDH